jgi:hypothetical protein
MNNYIAEKKILAVMPFSATGKKLAMNAAGFADKVHADLLLLNLANDLVRSKNMVTKKRRPKSYSAKEFINQLQHANEDIPSLRDMQAIQQAPELAENNIDLVIAPSAEDGEEYENYLVDSLNPFKESGCKVLYLPEGEKLSSFDKALYITDIRYCDLDALKSMIELLRPFNTEITLVNLSASGLPKMDDETARSLVESDLVPLLKYTRLKFMNVKAADIIEDMEKIVEQTQPNLIAFASKKHAVYQRLFKSTQTKKPSFTKLPLLVFGC